MISETRGISSRAPSHSVRKERGPNSNFVEVTPGSRPSFALPSIRAAGFQAEALDVLLGHGIYWIRSGTLYRSRGMGASARPLAQIPGAGPAACVHALGPRDVLFSMESGGGLLRYDGYGISTALRFRDERSFVRHGGISVGPDGSIWVGEYGLYPDARCARLYRSSDAGRSFEFVAHFKEARHVHFVHALRRGGTIVTTGDIASERRMYYAPRGSRRIETLRDSWSGFTAMAESGGCLHAGTDLFDGNGIARFHGGLRAAPELRRLPATCDGPLRQIASIGARHLLAWCRVEDDSERYGNKHWGALLLSENAGWSWSIIHRIEGSQHEVPENFALLSKNPIRILTVHGTRAEEITIPCLKVPLDGISN